MWIKHRVSRIKTKARHLSHYLKTLAQANEIERHTDIGNSKQPVMLLYGFGATRRSVSILESRLRQDGFDVFSIKLGGFLEVFNTAPIDRVAKMIAEKIEGLCKRHPLPRMAVIGYSKGGLIGRYYLNYLGGAKRVHTLITLATPHQGNPWALLSNVLGLGLLSKGLRQMLPRSRFLRGLNTMPHPAGVTLVSIASEKDKSCPPKYCKLPHPENGKPIRNIVLPHLYHSDFVMKQSAYAEILKQLKAGFAWAETKNRG